MEEINATTRRWREIRKSLNLSQPQFAEMLDTTQAAISLIESGKTKNPSVDLINRLFKAIPDLNKVWFFDGMGPMFLPKEKNPASEMMASKEFMELPESYKLDPVLNEYFGKIQTVFTMQQDRIHKLEIQLRNLEKDKEFLQDMVRKNHQMV